MITIETQGLSEDYKTATGEYNTVKRGEVSKNDLLKILEQVAKHAVPSGENDCPPSVNVTLNGDYICFHGDSGVIRFLGSQQEEMSPTEALSIISGEITISDFDTSKGYVANTTSNNKLILAILLVLVVGAILLLST